MASEIKKPKSSTITVNTTGGTVKAKLTWSAAFSTRWNNGFSEAQQYVDSEVLRYCAAMVPLQTGNLKESGTTGTTVGSGEVRYIAVYSAYQYYNTSETRSYDANRGGKWFERMKAAYKDSILAGAKTRFP